MILVCGLATCESGADAGANALHLASVLAESCVPTSLFAALPDTPEFRDLWALMARTGVDTERVATREQLSFADLPDLSSVSALVICGGRTVLQSRAAGLFEACLQSAGADRLTVLEIASPCPPEACARQKRLMQLADVIVQPAADAPNMSANAAQHLLSGRTSLVVTQLGPDRTVFWTRYGRIDAHSAQGRDDILAALMQALYAVKLINPQALAKASQEQMRAVVARAEHLNQRAPL